MRIEDLVSDEVKRKLNYLSKSKKKRRKNKEHLSKRDLEELMGVNRDIYVRRNGAIRRR